MEEFGMKVYSTKAQIENFKESLIWKDICRELDFWVEGFNHEAESIVDTIKNENLSTAATLTWIGNIDGRKKAVEYMKQLPDIFLSILNDAKEEKEDN